jgi:hypothetical protein
MKVLIACEESQTVCKAFRAKGHKAYSCDINDCSGGHPEWHIRVNVRKVIFPTKWDMIIAHPPCTYLCNSGVQWLYDRDGKISEWRWEAMETGALFFKAILDADCDKIAIENPIMHKYAKEIIGRGQDQIVQPWMFGHTETKATCLWLKGLPKLVETDNVREEMLKLPKNVQQRLHYLPPGPDRAKLRSKTFSGLAAAMADQWG